MSLHLINEKLKTLGLNEKQREEMLDMIRLFAMEVLRRNLGL